jgi:Ca2+-binding EF-hand superfamily protein
MPRNPSQKNKYLDPLLDRPLLESVKASKGQNQKMSRTDTQSDKKHAMMFGARPYHTFPFVGELQNQSKSKHRRSLSSLQMNLASPKEHQAQPEPTQHAGFKQRRASRGSCEVALELNCPLETTLDAKSLFDQHAKKGKLDCRSFGEIVVQIMRSTRQQLTEEDMKDKIEMSWREADRNKKGTVGFDEFALWYSSWGFQQEMLLSPQKIRRGTLTRDFAKKHDIDVVDVDAVYTKFQHFDEDGSGLIEFPEFVKLLHSVLKVPTGAELPASRLSHFWKEIDIDGSGSVCADEFLQWFLRYFDVKGNSNVSPLEHFYQSMRPNLGR